VKQCKIVVTGPESTGKSTLSKALAQAFDAIWVPEYARKYLDQLNRPYQQQDLLKIARGQVESEYQLQQQASINICDTDLTVIKIWSEYKYGNCHPWINEHLRENRADLYLLSYPDLAWEPDPQRENPLDRNELFDLYQSLLMDLQVEYKVIKGVGKERLDHAKRVVETKFF